MPKQTESGTTLADIGEKELINRLKVFMPIGQTEDDTAQIASEGKHLLINTDVLVEGIHFSEKTTSPNDVGWKAITSNISDLASSGVEQIIGVTVGLIAPPKTTWDWIENVYKGMNSALNQFGGNLLGGDCSVGHQRLLAVTAIGTLGTLRLHRSHALPGDQLIVSGPHGLSRLGLALLLSENQTELDQLSSQIKAEAIRIHQRPNPPLKALKTLESCKPKELPWRAGGTDSSDGLLEAVNSLCSSSNCQAVLDLNQLPRRKQWPSGQNFDEWCLNGGEDYELVLSLPSKWARALLQALPSSQKIGFMRNGPPHPVWKDGTKIKKPKTTFEHF